MKKQTLYSLVQQFLLIHLRSTKGLSENSIQSYRDTLRLFFGFVANINRKKTHRLNLDDFSTNVVLDFLNYAEKNRKNQIRTRNHRLTLLRSFFSFLLIYDEVRSETYEKILQISAKRGPAKDIECLNVKEIDAILSSINCETKNGLRDYTMILLMYNTGCRVQEICDLKRSSFSLTQSPTVTLVGKGNKSRVVPIWEKTHLALKKYQNFTIPEDGPMFLNPQSLPITRHGVADILKRRAKKAEKKCPSIKNKQISPHIIRHTTATHLLEAGVDLTVIRAWLGHVSIRTTSRYVDINLKMKQDALFKKKPPKIKQELRAVYQKNKDVISWLKTME